MITKCKICGRKKVVTCLCGFCNDCIYEKGHEYLLVQVAKEKEKMSEFRRQNSGLRTPNSEL
jgi:hypothetical protein